MSSPSETPYWSLVHKLNGQLLRSLDELINGTIGWDSKQWVCNVIILDRNYKEIIEVHFQTSATLFEGRVFDKSENDTVFDSMDESKTSISALNQVRGLNNQVPLIDSFTSHSVKTGNVVWVDDIQSLSDDDNNPLNAQYREFKYVSVRSDALFTSEYVFPIRIRINTNETILGVLNMECKEKINGFSQIINQQAIIGLILSFLDVHAPFLLTAARVAPKNISDDMFGNQKTPISADEEIDNYDVIKNFEEVHLKTINAKVKNLLSRWRKTNS